MYPIYSTHLTEINYLQVIVASFVIKVGPMASVIHFLIRAITALLALILCLARILAHFCFVVLFGCGIHEEYDNDLD